MDTAVMLFGAVVSADIVCKLLLIAMFWPQAVGCGINVDAS